MTCGGSRSLVAMRSGITMAQGRSSPLWSRAADEWLGSSASACENQAVLHDAHACPCCGHRTLAERASAVSSYDEIVSSKADIVTTMNEDGVVVVWGSAGDLRLRYRDLALRFDHGAPLALAALDECARAYWDEWERRVPQPERKAGDQ